MKKKNYAYNESFFASWLETSKVKKKDVAAVLGTNNDGILRWSVGDYPKDRDGHKDKSRPREIVAMSADKMVALCNEYGIDISAFFLEDGQPVEIKRMGRRKDSGRDMQKEMEQLKERLADANSQKERKDRIITDLQESNARLVSLLADAESQRKNELDKLERMMQATIDAQRGEIEALRNSQKNKKSQTAIGLAADPVEEKP